MEIETLQYKQKDKEIYIFSADPNYIKKMVRISDISKSDDNFQRPYSLKRVNEIKTYILGKDKLYKKGKDIFAKGYMPNAIVINLSKKFKIENNNNKIYIIFPDIEEIDSYQESIEIIDGQHRLLAFDDECNACLNNQKDKYEMCFVALIDLSSNEKKEIFMVLNERQETVDRNILLRQKKLLNLLLDEEEVRYDIISKLNIEDDSPFKGRFIMAGEKIKYGLKANQVDEVFHSSKILGKLVDSNNNISDINYKLIKNYFTAWQMVYKKVWFVGNNTLTKSAGFRFICLLFPYVHEVLQLGGGKDFRIESFQKLIEEIKALHFNDDFDIVKADKFQWFQERGGITKLADKIGKALNEKYKGKEEDILV